MTTYGIPVWSTNMHDDIPAEVGDLVRTAMAEAHITQLDVAKELDLPQSQVSRRLSGHIPFNVAELVKVAEMCGVTAASFMPAAAVA